MIQADSEPSLVQFRICCQNIVDQNIIYILWDLQHDATIIINSPRMTMDPFAVYNSPIKYWKIFLLSEWWAGAQVDKLCVCKMFRLFDSCRTEFITWNIKMYFIFSSFHDPSSWKTGTSIPHTVKFHWFWWPGYSYAPELTHRLNNNGDLPPPTQEGFKTPHGWLPVLKVGGTPLPEAHRNWYCRKVPLTHQ